MSEKVKLPKEVCKALDWAKKHGYLLPALTLGYEPEVTPEERIKERYKNGFRGDSQGIFRAGIREALQIHGIKYDWLEGDLEC